jgi:hypothetical protein
MKISVSTRTIKETAISENLSYGDMLKGEGKWHTI